MNPKVSIIIPAYNAEKHIDRAIKSALAQTYENLEVIVVDDGSTDKTIDICKIFEKEDKKVYCYRKENGGVSSARNFGIKKASGKYVFFLDSDDEIEPTVIDNLVKKHSAGALISCRMVVFDGKKKKEVYRECSYSSEKAVEKIISNKIQGYVCGYLFEKNKCPKFNERTSYCEDMLFLVEYIKNNNIKKIEFMPLECGVYVYTKNADSLTAGRANTIRKLKDIEISMSILNVLTDKKYAKKIHNKEVSLFEYEMRFSGREDFKNILELFSIPKYTGKSMRLKIFSNIARKRNVNTMVFYYFIRKIAKSIIKFS